MEFFHSLKCKVSTLRCKTEPLSHKNAILRSETVSSGHYNATCKPYALGRDRPLVKSLPIPFKI